MEKQYFSDMTTEELEKEASSLYDVIYNIDCYSVSDLKNLDGAVNELGKRGISAEEEVHGKLVFDKEVE